MPHHVAGPAGQETTGRFVVTFREGAHTEALAILKKGVSLSESALMASADFGEEGIDVAQVPESGGVWFQQIGVAVISADEAAMGALVQDLGADSPILAVEPEGIMYALDQAAGLSAEYLRGFRDAAQALHAQAAQAIGQIEAEVTVSFVDTPLLTWGLQATKVPSSRYTGKGIRVAILDTGLDLKHPDFAGRRIVSRSFIPGVATVQDGHGHGTHCTGTACGPLKPGQGRRYGIAYGADVFIGKVLSDQGSGSDTNILAGIDWAVTNKCNVVSMSLGANVPTTSVAYETAGTRALNAGTLIVAAAGNNAERSQGNYGFVGRPANSRSFMAVAAIDSSLRIADFSARDTAHAPGTAVDIAAPGVEVYSSWPMPTRYRTISGTSMATPHVSGIAALLAEATGAHGAALWQRVITHAQTLSVPVVDVGRGLIQAP